MAEPSKLLERAQKLGRAIDPRLDERDVERLKLQGRARSRRPRARARLRVGMAAAAAAAAVIIVTWNGLWPHPAKRDPGKVSRGNSAGAPLAPASTSTQQSEAPASAPRRLVLLDRSQIQPLDGSTELSVLEDSARSVRVRLSRGRSHFDVTPRAERVFTVVAAGVELTVLGTAFDVEVVADRVGVEVERGSVRVDWRLGARRLGAGEGGWFPPLVLDDSTQTRGTVDRPSSTRLPSSAAPAGLDPLEAGISQAAGSTGSESSAAARGPNGESAQELLARADAARARSDAAGGAELLRRVLREHATDPRAPLAALTLGRLLLNELHRPAEAAAAFKQVGLRAPGSPFAEDALAHEAEAWLAAGAVEKSRELAKLYLKRYPAGRHARHVRALAESE